MSKYTEVLNEITKYQVELEYTMQGTDKWRNAMWTCKEALEIADRLEQADVTKHKKDYRNIEDSEWDSGYQIGYINGFEQALADIRGNMND